MMEPPFNEPDIQHWMEITYGETNKILFNIPNIQNIVSFGELNVKFH